MKKNKQQIIRVYPELKRRFKQLAAEKNSTMTELILMEFRQILIENDLPTI